tara:strand:+ start:966 stop:1874 length:909 start_codon:yes stop_codon:yes gene_type:complete
MKLLQRLGDIARWIAIPSCFLLASSALAAPWPELSEKLSPLVEKAANNGVRLSIGVLDLTAQGSDAKEVLLGSANSYPPASTVKMLLVSALMEQVDAGTLSLSDMAVVEAKDIVGGYGVVQNEPTPQEVPIARLAELMITISDNTATNVLVDVVGYPAMADLATRLELPDLQFARKMFGTPNPPEVENYITAADTIVLLQAIYKGDFLSASSRQQILDWMSAQTVKTKIGAGVPADIPIAHKTGENGPVSHDVGFILLPGKEVAIAIFSETSTSRDFDTAQAQLNPMVAEVARTVALSLQTE